MWVGPVDPGRFFRRSSFRSMNTRIHICCRTAGRAEAVRGPVLPPCKLDRTGAWHSANEIGRRDRLEAGRVEGVCPVVGTPRKSADRTECVSWPDLTQGTSRGQERGMRRPILQSNHGHDGEDSCRDAGKGLRGDRNAIMVEHVS